MLNNFYTLVSVSEYFNKYFSGYFISEIFSQEKNRLIFEIKKDDTGTDIKMLEFSVEKDNNYLVEKSFFAKAKKNYADVFPEVHGRKILGTEIYSNDRAIFLRLEDDTGIMFTFYTNKANCYVIKNLSVINSFKNKDENSGRGIGDVLSPKVKNENIPPPEGSIRNLIKQNYRKLGNIYVNELIYRLNLNEHEIINQDKFNSLKTKIDGLLKQFENPEFILYKKEKDVLLSLIDLKHIPGYAREVFNNVNQLILEFLKYRFRQDKIENYKTSKLNEYSQKISLVDKKLSGINNQLLHCENSDALRIHGEIIIQNSYLLKKGDKYFNYSGTNGEAEKIKLKENLSPVENANIYFDKYKKQKASVETLKLKIIKLEAEKMRLKSEYEGINELHDIKKIMKEDKKSAVNKNDETSRFRKFKISDKFEVWVGKDSVSNDLLTTKYSSQNDLWFHVRGASGSHTVLKIENKKEIPSKEVINAAASVAAYYSKARNSSSVPVAYCEKKYVKKKKGFKSGSVTMEREKVIFVKPSLPAEKNN